jgi:hypothetical protein
MAEEKDVSVVVFQTQNENEALVIEGLLEVHGIFCYRTSDISHSVYPLSVDGLGLVKVLVHSSKAEEALRIIQEHSREQQEGQQEGQNEE